MNRCEQCPYTDSECVNPTPSAKRGNKPRFIIVGESPGRQEVIQGEGFVGPAGSRLDSVLAACGIDRDDCYITNCFKCMPTDKKNKKKAAHACQEALFEELAAIDCEEILAFGDIAVQTLTGNCVPLKDWQGYWYPSLISGKKVHALWHPAFTLASRRPAMLIPLIASVQHIVANGPSLPEKAPKLSLERLREASEIVVDVENDTTGMDRSEMDPRKMPLVLIGAGTCEGALNVHWPPLESERETWAVLKQKLEDPRVTKIGQNFIHDTLSIKYKAGVEMKGRLDDLMIMHATKHPALDHDLGTIFAQYFFNRRWKNYADEDFEEYNLLDVHRTAHAFEKVRGELRQAYSRADFYYRQAVRLDLEVGRKMREIGFLTDPVERERLYEEQVKKKEAAAERFRSLFPEVELGEDGNTGQLRRLFFDRFGVKPLELSDGGAPSFNGYLLRWCKINATRAIAEPAAILLDYKEAAKKISTYLRGKYLNYIDTDNVVHSGWHSSWRAINGRWSSERPNIQNIPKDLRSMYVARPGKVLLEVDYSQIEVWIQALWSQDEELLRWHDAGLDIHTENAKKMFAWSLQDSEKVRDKKRQAAKTAPYAFGYNFSDNVDKVVAATWRKGIEMTHKEISLLRKTWFASRPRLYAGQRWLVSEAERKGYTESWGGRRFHFPVHKEIDKNQALNLPTSSTVADLMNESIEEVNRNIDWNETVLLAQVHDALLLETTPDKLESVRAMVKEVMQKTITIRGRALTFFVDTKSGTNWG